MLYRLFASCILCLSAFSFVVAQPGKTVLLSPQIKTLQLTVDGNVESFPVISKNGNETLSVSFDDMTHEYRRFTYKIQHCEPNGDLSSELFEDEYVNAASDEEVIEDYNNSLNTSVLYTHYTFTLPNTHVRPLLSGNYLLTIFVEDEEGELEPVVKTYFGVLDRKVGISLTADTDTEVDHNDSHQQLTMRIDCSDLNLRNAESEIQTIVMQNRRYDTAKFNPKPTAQNGSVLLWEHDRNLIFKAGNEYRKMEILSTRYPGQHGESVRWFAPYYHYTLMTDYPRKNYLYDEDRNGLYVTRWSGNGDADIEADYVVTHFSLEMPRIANSDVYIGGRFASLGFTPDYKMEYNEALQRYELSLLLKTGYYNYMYFSVPNNGDRCGNTQLTEGDFYQSENEYDVLVYYRSFADRYWQLVGCITPTYKR